MLFAFLLTMFCGSLAFGQSSADLKKKKLQLQKEIDLLQKSANKAASNKNFTQKQINNLNAKITLMQEKIEVINSEVRKLDNEIHQNTNTVKNLEGQLGQLKKEYAAMIRFAQKNQSSYTKIMFIFASQDFHQAYMRMKYLQQFGTYRRKQAGFIQGKEKDLKYKIVVLDKNKKEKSNLMLEQENEKNKLGQNKEERAKALDKYSSEEKIAKQGIADRRKKQSALDREIRAAIARDIAIAKRKAEEAKRLELARIKAAQEKERLAKAKLRAEEIARAKAANKPVPPPSARTTVTPEEEKPASSSNYIEASPVLAKLSSDFERNRGSLPRPVGGRVTERYGRHTEGQAIYFNDGINIEPAEGASVRTVFGGTVRAVGNQYGKYYILINHGAYYTVYQNLRSASVSVGEKVSTGQNIGVVANSEGKPHLQFQIWKGEKSQNPEAWLGG